jgi:hypothetical protein
MFQKLLIDSKGKGGPETSGQKNASLVGEQENEVRQQRWDVSTDKGTTARQMVHRAARRNIWQVGSNVAVAIGKERGRGERR